MLVPFYKPRLICSLPKTIKALRYLSTKSESPLLPECSFSLSEYKCRLSLYEIERIHKLNLNPSLTTWYKKPLVLTQGHMQYVFDNNGKRYLDMFGGIVTTSVGHCHPKLVEAVTKQLNKLWHVSSIYLHEETHEFASKLCHRFPDPLNNVFFCNSGSEANDLALLMARLFTGSYDVIALRNGYHGCTSAAQGLCGIGTWKFPVPGNFGIQHTTNPDPYQGRFGGSKCRDSLVQTSRSCDCTTQCDACDKYIEDLEDLLDSTMPRNKIAGLVAESIQGVGGVVQFPKDYLRRAHELVKKRGGLLIVDEVQTGFGRTGTDFWGFQSHGVIPDIVTMAKGIGNGFPLAAVITRSDIAASVSKALFFNTFGGNPVACRVGSQVLNIIDEEKLQQNSKHLGARLMNGLSRLMSDFEGIVGDVRGKGLMIGVEMVTEKKSRKAMSKQKFDSILEDCKEMGLLLGKGGAKGNVFRITPPMCINEEDVKFTLEVLGVALKNYANGKKSSK